MAVSKVELKEHLSALLLVVSKVSKKVVLKASWSVQDLVKRSVGTMDR